MITKISEFLRKEFPDLIEDFVPFLSQAVDDITTPSVDSISQVLTPYLESYGIDIMSDDYKAKLEALSELLISLKPHLKIKKEKKPKRIDGFSVSDAAVAVEEKIRLQKAIEKDVAVNINSEINDEENLKKAKLRADRTQRRLERNKTKSPSVSPSEEPEAAAPVLSVDLNAVGNGKNIDIEHVTIGVPNKSLLEDAALHLTHNHKYGLIGRNGVGKSTLLRHIARRLLPGFPQHISIMFVEQEIEGCDKTCIDFVLGSDTIYVTLKERKEELSKKAEHGSATVEELQELQTVTNEYAYREYDKAMDKCLYILKGLGFTDDYIHKQTQELSGGWRMRVSLAAALFSHPDLLLLDEPTNHLDLPTVTWLQDFLVEYEGSCVFVSHDRYFLNYIVTDIVLLRNKRLLYYKGDYNTYEKSEHELLLNRQRELQKVQDREDHMMKFINRFRFNANRADLVQSRLKEMKRLEEQKEEIVKMGYGEEEEQKLCVFKFNEPEPLPFPILQIIDVAFGYIPSQILFHDLNFGIDMQSRIGILGRNGVGKSTLIKIIMGELNPTEGLISRNPKLRIAYFAQHHVDQMDFLLTPMESMWKIVPKATEDEVRSGLARFGITAEMASRPNKTLSGGQKTRLAFALLAIKKPDIYILDEPTNHLDIETITVLADALSVFKGGVICVSHDQFFVSKVCTELWTLRDKSIIKFEGDFRDYKRIVLK
ncbi:hypothetical protein WA158_002082, partial [Blastocystis sp. Blastoise]